MATYRGMKIRTQQGGMVVKKDDDILSPKPSQKLYNYSDGFNWGYGGSGPAQLALALLLDVTGDKDIALGNHQQFKWAIVAKFEDEWQITTKEIKAWLQRTK